MAGGRLVLLVILGTPWIAFLEQKITITQVMIQGAYILSLLENEKKKIKYHTSPNHLPNHMID